MLSRSALAPFYSPIQCTYDIEGAVKLSGTPRSHLTQLHRADLVRFRHERRRELFVVTECRDLASDPAAESAIAVSCKYAVCHRTHTRLTYLVRRRSRPSGSPSGAIIIVRRAAYIVPGSPAHTPPCTSPCPHLLIRRVGRRLLQPLNARERDVPLHRPTTVQTL